VSFAIAYWDGKMKRGIVLAPDEPVWVVRDLDALIDLWLKHCQSRLPAATFRSYRSQMGHFRRWLAANGPALNWELRKEDMQRFVSDLETAGPAYNTRKGAVKRLRSMLHWANETNRTEGVDYRSWVPRPKGSKPVRVAAPILDLINLLEAADRSPYPARDRAVLAVLLGAGLRRAEASALNVEDVEILADGSGTLVVREAKVVEGRENHWRIAAFDAPTGRYIRAWVDKYDRRSGPLFPAYRGGRDRLGDQGIYKVVKRLIALAGLSKKLQGPHDLRRNFTTYFARQRRGAVHGQLISKQLGHSSFAMTSTYNLQDAEDLREVIASPFMLIEALQIQRGKTDF
jgi:integrase/recombinase XerC